MDGLGRLGVSVDEATGARTYLRYMTAFGRFGAAVSSGLIAVGFVGVPLLIGAVALLLGGPFGGLGILAFSLGFAGFGTYALLGVPASWRLTGGPPGLLTVGPEGIAVRDQFQLRWDDILEIRLGRPISAFRWAPTTFSHSLEIVPRDAVVLARRHWSERALDAYRRVLGMVLPFPRLQVAALRFDLTLLEAPWRPVVADIQQYIEVAGVPRTA